MPHLRYVKNSVVNLRLCSADRGRESRPSVAHRNCAFLQTHFASHSGGWQWLGLLLLGRLPAPVGMGGHGLILEIKIGRCRAIPKCSAAFFVHRSWRKTCPTPAKIPYRPFCSKARRFSSAGRGQGIYELQSDNPQLHNGFLRRSLFRSYHFLCSVVSILDKPAISCLPAYLAQGATTSAWP